MPIIGCTTLGQLDLSQKIDNIRFGMDRLGDCALALLLLDYYINVARKYLLTASRTTEPQLEKERSSS